MIGAGAGVGATILDFAVGSGFAAGAGTSGAG